ncbi:MAG: hypothetical protein RL141_579 [Candidatus Parcubacteria bacterium]
MVEGFVTTVTTTLQQGGEVNIAGFGAFMARTRKGRMGVNPQNPSQKMEIPSVVVPKFKAGKGLKDALKAKPPAVATAPVAASAPAPAAAPAPQPPTPPAPPMPPAMPASPTM